MTAQYLYGPDIDEPLAYYNTSAWSYYEQDGLGSVTSLTNSSGSVTSTYGYDSFGNPSATVSGQPFRYTGREWDPETGLYYYRARYYDATVGHFQGEDSWRFAEGTNFYAYARNNPAAFIDPLGHESGAAFKEGWYDDKKRTSYPGFIYYGNWGGPDWQGAQHTALEDLPPGEKLKLKAPVDPQDGCYRLHDYCYSLSRTKHVNQREHATPGNAIGHSTSV